jgi:hypothetical protein
MVTPLEEALSLVAVLRSEATSMDVIQSLQRVEGAYALCGRWEGAWPLPPTPPSFPPPPPMVDYAHVTHAKARPGPAAACAPRTARRAAGAGGGEVTPTPPPALCYPCLLRPSVCPWGTAGLFAALLPVPPL